jgi:hypothetical protein
MQLFSTCGCVNESPVEDHVNDTLIIGVSPSHFEYHDWELLDGLSKLTADYESLRPF